MSAYSKNSGFMGGKGFYVALALCLAGAGAAAYLTAGNPGGVTENELPQAQQSQQAPAKEMENPVSDVPVDTQDAFGPSRQEELSELQEQMEEEPAAVPAPSVPQETTFILPVGGEVVSAFSNGNLVRNETLGDWRTHNGIDIRADQGTNVAAAADGTVTGVEQDPLWGTVITIDHGDSLTSVTRGLTKNVTVKTGDSVAKGQIIGEVGAAAAESLLPSHIHFEMKQGESYVDPLTTMGLK